MKQLFATILIAIFLCSQQGLQAQFCFTLSPSHPDSSFSPTSMGTNDFNNDGKPDFYVANGSGLSVILQHSQLNMDTVLKVDSSSIFNNTSCTADFNKDGKADIVTHNYGPGEFAVYLGKGNGTFQAPTTFSTGLFNVRNTVCAADFNKDGNMDLVISTSFNLVKVFLGNGDGTFAAALATNTTTGVNGQLIAADFNKDGKIDLATTTLVMLGDGAGHFSSGTSLAGTFSPQSVLAADFNSDGKLDVATLNWGSSQATSGYIGNTAIFLGDGLGGFSSPVFSGIGDSTIPLNNTINLFIHADYDGDGQEDLAMGVYAHQGTDFIGRVSLLKGNGLGGFTTLYIYNQVENPRAMVGTDINQDGLPDIAAMAQFETTTGITKLIPMYNCKVSSVVELDEQKELIKVYPNPSHGSFTIEAASEMEEIKVTDMLGRVVFETQEPTSTQKLQLPTAGLYFINVVADHHHSTQKISITH